MPANTLIALLNAEQRARLVEVVDAFAKSAEGRLVGGAPLTQAQADAQVAALELNVTNLAKLPDADIAALVGDAAMAAQAALLAP